MSRRDVAGIRGDYRMDDGRTASVRNVNRKLILDFDGRFTELYPVDRNVFEADGSDMTLAYSSEVMGRDDAIVLSYTPQRTMAGVAPGRIRLSSR